MWEGRENGLVVHVEKSTNEEGITGPGDTDMGECNQEVENNRGITETEPEPEIRDRDRTGRYVARRRGGTTYTRRSGGAT